MTQESEKWPMWASKECGADPSQTPGSSRNSSWAGLFHMNGRVSNCERTHSFLWLVLLLYDMEWISTNGTPTENLGHFKSKKDSSTIDQYRPSSPQHQLLIKMGSPTSTFTLGQETLGVGHLFYIFNVESHLKDTVKQKWILLKRLCIKKKKGATFRVVDLPSPSFQRFGHLRVATPRNLFFYCHEWDLLCLDKTASRGWRFCKTILRCTRHKRCHCVKPSRPGSACLAAWPRLFWLTHWDSRVFLWPMKENVLHVLSK